MSLTRGRYRATPDTLQDLQWTDLRVTTDGSLVVSGSSSITSVIPGTGATNLGKAEDAAHTSGDVGVMALGVRKDTAAAFGGDGDYTPIRVDQYGDINTLLVDSAGAALTYNANGQATMANSTAVVIASNQSNIPVTPQAVATGGASFLNIAAGQATTVVKSGAGTLYALVLNSAATATNTTIMYDNTAGSGTAIGRPAVTTATVPTTLTFGAAGLAFATGLTIVTATANGGDMTVIYK